LSGPVRWSLCHLERAKRHVPLSNRMRKLLELRVPGHTHWVFPSERAACGHLTTINRQWASTVEAANQTAVERNQPPISASTKPYCTRHTFATDILAHGLNLVEVRNLLGHEDATSTMRYLYTDTSGVESILNQRNCSRSLPLLEARSEIPTKLPLSI
jgi:integrase